MSRLDEIARLMQPGDFVDLVRRPEWHARAACRGLGPDLFFVSNGGDTGPGKALCAECPVTTECLAQARETASHGTWGGTSLQQRRGQPESQGFADA